jgi:hypothetical protein
MHTTVRVMKRYLKWQKLVLITEACVAQIGSRLSLARSRVKSVEVGMPARGLDNRIMLEHAHIIPEVEIETVRSDIPHSTHRAEMDAVGVHA